jgi:hypothetical protein
MSDQCNADAFSMGESVGFMDTPKEMRYLVLKLRDLSCLNEVAEHRAAQGKQQLEEVFIERGWVCYDDAWKLVTQEFSR